MKTVYVIATLDTKGAEARFVADQLRVCGVDAKLVDVSVHGKPSVTPDITRYEVLSSNNQEIAHAPVDVTTMDRGQAVQTMSIALSEFLISHDRLHRFDGLIGLGGSGGTSLLSRAFREVPVGVPKGIVSTVASGNTANYIGCTDIVLFPSIVDVAGLNIVSKQMFSNAAHAIAGMVLHRLPLESSRSTLGMTMFGVTTPCVDRVRSHLEQQGFDCLVFHATGIGGQAMEGLVSSRFIHGLLDLTTTEVADEIVGGIFPAGAKRFQVLSQVNLPCVLSIGAMDMVNFGPMASVPDKFRHRRLHVHNENVTLMRTNVDENRQCARWLADRVRHALGPTVLLLPVRGVSALDAPGKPFEDPHATSALIEELEAQLAGSSVRVERVDAHINDAAFADRVYSTFESIWQTSHRMPVNQKP